MIDLLHAATFLQRNPVLAGGAGLGIAGTIFASLKSMPTKAWGLLKRQFIVSADVQSSDALFYWFRLWLDQHPYTRSARSVSAAALYRPSDTPGQGDQTYVGFSPAPGLHVLRHGSRYFWLERTREKPDQYGRSNESIAIKTLGRKTQIIQDLFEEVRKVASQNDATLTRVFLQSGTSWDEFLRRRPRKLSTVVLPRKTKTDLLEDIRRFVSNKKWYDDLGIPYRRGYLFYGPPGSGKSSLATALAGEIQRDLYVLSLATRGLDDQGLMQLMSRVPSNGVLLIEDIDAAFAERDKSDTTSSQVTFSGLLNAFDGVGSRDGQIVIMSTNHIEKLDPALIRPGRVDWQAFLGNAVPEQVAELFLRFFPESGRANEFVEKVAQSEISMAALQNHFIQYTDEDDAVSHAVAA